MTETENKEFEDVYSDLEVLQSNQMIYISDMTEADDIYNKAIDQAMKMQDRILKNKEIEAQIKKSEIDAELKQKQMEADAEKQRIDAEMKNRQFELEAEKTKLECEKLIFEREKARVEAEQKDEQIKLDKKKLWANIAIAVVGFVGACVKTAMAYDYDKEGIIPTKGIYDEDSEKTERRIGNLWGKIR